MINSQKVKKHQVLKTASQLNQQHKASIRLARRNKRNLWIIKEG